MSFEVSYDLRNFGSAFEKVSKALPCNNIIIGLLIYIVHGCWDAFIV